MQYEQDVLRKLQLAELSILRDIDSVCRSEGIPYFLECGTLLGAVRHGGFIPWDDDIDVGMLRPDYERFLKVAPKALGERYAVCEPRANSRCAGMFAKVWKRGTKFFTAETMEAGIDQGIFVDVFPTTSSMPTRALLLGRFGDVEHGKARLTCCTLGM